MYKETRLNTYLIPEISKINPQLFGYIYYVEPDPTDEKVNIYDKRTDQMICSIKLEKDLHIGRYRVFWNYDYFVTDSTRLVAKEYYISAKAFVRDIVDIVTRLNHYDGFNYALADCTATVEMSSWHTMMSQFMIKDVIFNNPATIVLWVDGTKTVVKAKKEKFDPEKGLAMAIAKKAFGNTYDYYEIFQKYIGRYEKKNKKGR